MSEMRSGHGLRACDLPKNFNWNIDPSTLSPVPEAIPGEPAPRQVARTDLVSECLRDGLQGTSSYPSVDEMMTYVRLLDDFGITSATVGIFPGDTGSLSGRMKALLRRMREETPRVVPTVLSMCSDASLTWTVECKELNPALEAIVFIGTAPSRRLVQGWEMGFILDRLGTYIRRTVDHGVPVIAGTEHTSQTSPEDVRDLIAVQVASGASGIALADTIGVIRPAGTYRLVRLVRDELDRLGVSGVRVDWHGHRDTGNALGNALAATSAGADRIHVVSRGIGERSGNTALEEVVINFAAILEDAGEDVPWSMPRLFDVINSYRAMVGVPEPEHGVLGKRYSHTSAGIHTDAILKAHRLADEALRSGDGGLERSLRRMARTVYSAVDPEAVGGTMSVAVSPWSGLSAVRLAYMASGRDPESLSDERAEQVLELANELERELLPDELEACFADVVEATV
ncbi:hypothetical protein G6020_03330 [Dietzia sp. B19]|uniref:hypothetical protein n=1 Tax=Dietzia sp. B19 TaxID=1630632 RepID=UPI0015FE4B3B|nr:hypothetical protein [Dietzia sp. B19]MBB1056447.1 hypothetical protein [Dietzia sp. B19]